MDEIIKSLEKPQQCFKPTYFWSWNDKIEDEELCRQMRTMNEQDIGGFFIHARPGLKTPYMSAEWVSHIEKTVDECKSLGMSPWLYDEYGWPSGFNGGSVPSRGVEYQQKYLVIKELDAAEIEKIDNVLGIYRIENNKCIKAGSSNIEENGQYIAVWYEVVKDYVDLLSEKVVRAFIDDSYEHYKEYFGNEFGKVIPGIFTDEPQYSARGFPWSFDLPEEFRTLYGENIFDRLPALQFDFDGAEEFRYRYYSTVNKMFTLHYFKQIGDWCSKNDIKLTGHNMAEDSLYDSMLFNAGVMPSYEYMQMPGTDWVSRTVRETTTPKQCSSVANQLGKPRVLTEQFASCNWDVPLEELKWIIDWNYVNGVNFFCQHLASYSLKGLRKRDCPASLFDHNVWWEKYNLLTNYMARLSSILSGNQEICDAVVIHPLKSAYLFFKRENNGEMLNLDIEFLSVLDYLSGMHISYNLADEEILKRHGSVKSNTLVIGECSYKAVFVPPIHTLEKNTYELLLQFAENGGKIYSFGRLPDRIDGIADDLSALNSRIIDCSDLESFKAISDVVRSKNEDGCATSQNSGMNRKSASLSNGVFTAEYTNFWEKTTQGILPRTCLDMPAAKYINCSEKTKAFLSSLAAAGISHISVSQNGKEINNIHFYQKLYQGRAVYFFANHHKYDRYFADVILDSGKNFVGYDPVSNRVFGIDSFVKDGRFCFRYCFEPMQSLLIIESQEAVKPSCEESVPIGLGNAFDVLDYDFNALNIDYCQYREEGSEWSAPLPVWDVHYLLLKGKKNTDFEMKFTFEINKGFHFGKTLELGMEDMELALAVLLNGQSVKERFSGSRVERSIRTADISDLAVEGTNELIIKKHYKYDETAYYTLFGKNVHNVMLNRLCLYDETDSVYIFGNFAVYSKTPFADTDRNGTVTSGGFVIDNETRCLDGLDIVKQGYLFFNRALTISQKRYIEHIESGKKYYLDLGEIYATAVDVQVNGKDAGSIVFHPNRVDITSLIVEGENEIILKIYTSNRNLFGNFHYKLGQIHWSNWARQINPKEWLFCDEEKSWFSPKYCFYRNGIRG